MKNLLDTIPYATWFILLLFWILLIVLFPSKALSATRYTIIKDDTLSSIAQKELGSWRKWEYLVKINNLPNTAIVPGQQIKLIDWTNINIKPTLAKWIHKHSIISRKMVAQIVDEIIKTQCPLLLLALMKTESHYSPTALSEKGAMGLGQVMPFHEKKLITAGILTEMRDIFKIPVGVRATEFMWQFKLKKAKGNIRRAFTFYYGERNLKYINGVLKDYYILMGLCSEY